MATPLTIIVPASSTPTTVVFDTTVTQSGGTPIPPPTSNIPPTVSIVGPTSITLPATLSLSATATDVDGTIIGYLWTKTVGGAATIVSPLTATTNITGLAVGSYTFKIEVTDNKGAKGTVSHTVAVKAVTPPPGLVANAGADVSVTGNYAILDGLQSVGATTYAWSKISGPASFHIDNPTLARCGFSQLVAGTYVFRLTVTGIGGTATDDASIIVGGTPQPIPPLPPPSTPPLPTPSGNEIFRITSTGYDHLNSGTWSAMTKYNSTGIGNITTGGVTIRGQIFTNSGTTNSNRCVRINASNVTLENCIIGEGNGIGLEIGAGVNNVTIKNCLFHNLPIAVYINRTTGNIKFIDNWSLNQEWDWLTPVFGFRNGQFLCFEAAVGTGNEVVGNRIENNFGESFNEDIINTFASSNISVRNNKLRGGQGSFTGGGIIAGDNGSNNIDILNNDLIDPGWYGIQVYGGNDVTVTGNRIWSPNALPWNSVGFLIYNGSGSCTNMVMNSTNSSYYRRRPQFGNIYNYEDGGGCSGSLGGVVNDPDLLAKMNFPSHLINCVSVDDYWKLRSMKWRQQAIINSHSNCQNCPDVNPRRPSANAGADQTVTTTSATLNGSSSSIAVGGNGTFTLSKFTWEQVGGPNKATITAPNSATTPVTGLVNGVYTFRLVVEQNNSQHNLKTYHADWVNMTKQ